MVGDVEHGDLTRSVGTRDGSDNPVVHGFYMRNAGCHVGKQSSQTVPV